MAEPPPYEFCTVIPDIQASSGTNKEIRCVEAMGCNIYLGCSNGSLLRYVLDESADGNARYVHYSEYTLPSHSPIESMQLIPSVSKAIVLSNDHLFFFALPSFEPVSSEMLRPMKNVLGFVVNETLVGQEPVGLAVLKQSTISFWELGSKLNYLKELKVSVVCARRAGSSLCVADTERYSVIDLRTSGFVPVHPISLSETWKILPQVAVSKLNEYLLVVCTGTSPDYKKVYSMGIFVNGEGDPTQAPLEWGSYPTTVCVDGEMVFSLHLDANSSEPTPTIEVRMINSQTLHQSFSLEAIQGNIQLLSLARPGFATPVNARQEKLTQKDIPIFEAKRVKENGTKKTVKGGDENVQNPAGSSLTPPPTPKPPRPGHQYSRSQGKGDVAIETAQGSEAPSALPTSHILLATSRAVYALLPLTLLSQIESLIDEGKVKEASALLSQSQAKHAKDENLVTDFQYLNLRIGFRYLAQTAFEDAGDALFRGDMDPRWLMGLWEEWRDVALRTSSGALATMNMFSGLEPHLVSLRGKTISQIVTNYSPHLNPSTTQSSSWKELQSTLEWSARNMLEKYLRKFRNKRRFMTESMSRIYTDEQVNRAVDTVSVMLYAGSNDSDESQELQILLDESPHIVFDEVRDTLAKNGRAGMLARVYERRGNRPALIDLYIKVAEGVLIDPSISNPVGEVAVLLRGSQDRNFVRRHALWLLKRDAESGLRLLISSLAEQPQSLSEDAELLSQITEINAHAGLLFLEHLVLQKQTRDGTLHTQLAIKYITSVVKNLEEPQWLEVEKTTLRSYLNSEQHQSTPFLSYLAFERPASDNKTMRLKLCLLLQGSDLYSLDDVRRSLRVHGSQHSKILALEKSILDSKADDHKSALSIIVNELQDFTTAEAYCSLGGRVITPKLAAAIGDRLDLHDWAALILTPDALGAPSSHGYTGRLRREASSGSLGTRRIQSEDLKERSGANRAVQLTRMLLEVYMGAGEKKATEASKLLNAQAINLEAEDIVPLMPSTWSLSLVSSFLSRSFRRSLHKEYEGQILKQLSAGQNLQTSGYALEEFAAAGSMIEEPNDDETDESDHENEKDPEELQGQTASSLRTEEIRSKLEEKVTSGSKFGYTPTATAKEKS